MDLFRPPGEDGTSKHGVPTSRWTMATDNAADALGHYAENPSRARRWSAQVKVGGRGQGRRRQCAATRSVRRPKHPWSRHQGPYRQEAADRRGPATSLEQYLRPSLLDRANRTTASVLGRGRHGDRRGRRTKPERLAKVPVDAVRASTSPPPAPSPSRVTCPPRCSTPPRSPSPSGGATSPRTPPVEVNRWVRTPDDPDPPSTAGHPRRQRRLPSARPCRVRYKGRHRSARAQGQTARPELRQARRPVGIIGNGAGLVIDPRRHRLRR